MKAKLLNLEEALKMYELIRGFLPTEPATQIEAIKTMVSKMDIKTYFGMLGLLTGEQQNDLVKMNTDDRLSILVTGFLDNHLFELPRLQVLNGR
jgi:hypothetical protein